MRIDQTKNYLFQMERTVKDLVYLKQWADWNNVADQRRFSRADICLRGMSCVINRKDAVQNLFFEQVWKKIA